MWSKVHEKAYKISIMELLGTIMECLEYECLVCYHTYTRWFPSIGASQKIIALSFTTNIVELETLKKWKFCYRKYLLLLGVSNLLCSYWQMNKILMWQKINFKDIELIYILLIKMYFLFKILKWYFWIDGNFGRPYFKNQKKNSIV